MPQALLIARNPDVDSSLPYLVLIPLGAGIVLRTRETWPRTSKVYCHRHEAPWPEDADIVEEVPLASVSRRGAAIDIVADRTREARSQFVITRARGREMIFWQSPRVAKSARPNIALPTARAGGLEQLDVVVDTRERYPWKFTHQQAATSRRALPVGDYAALVDDEVVAVVERKTLADLLGECQVRWPSVPIVFAENRALAQEWTYRFLAGAVQERLLGEEARRILPAGEEDGPD